MNVNPGEFDKKIHIFKKKSGERDGDGFDQGERETIRRPWAKITRISGTQVMESGTTIESETVRFLFRAGHNPIESGNFIEYGGKTYRIIYANNYNDNNEYIETVCELERMT